MVRYRVQPDEVLSTLRQHILADGFHVAIDLEASHGSWIHDAVSGRDLLDFYSYFASLPIGHNHPKLVGDAQFMAALTRAAIANPANSDIYSAEYAAFVEVFAELAKPPEFRYLFFVAGGALAVENALKTAFDWKVRANRAAGRGDRGLKILHFREAFHGRSGYTLSLTNTDPVKTDGFPTFDWPRVTNPKLRFPVTAAVEREVAAAEARAVEEIERAFAANPDDIAAIIIEPIQGEGGDNHFRGEFLRELRRLAAASPMPTTHCSSSTRSRPASASPAGCGATSTSASHPTSSPSARRPRCAGSWSASGSTACPETCSTHPAASTRPGAATSPTWCVR